MLPHDSLAGNMDAMQVGSDAAPQFTGINSGTAKTALEEEIDLTMVAPHCDSSSVISQQQQSRT